MTEPIFGLGTRTNEAIRQWTIGAAYDLRWKGVGSLSLGIQRTDYRDTVRAPGVAPTFAHNPAWLPTGSVALNVTDKLGLYTSYTKGIEGSEVAPDSAANRTTLLPAILTTQIDGGIRWKMPGGMRLVAGLFSVTKPYFAADSRNVYTELGERLCQNGSVMVDGRASM